MGMVMAVVNMSLGIGMTIGPILAGVIADIFNTGYVFYFATATVFIGGVVFSWLTTQSNRGIAASS